MIATLTSRRMPPPNENLFSRNMNTAGAPLPLIPRRVSSGSRSHSTPSSPPNSNPVVSGPIKVIVQQSTPPRESAQPPVISDSDSGSSSSGSSSTRPTIRARRLRGVRSSVCPPEQSTPTPAVHNTRSSQQPRQPQSNTEKKDTETTPRPPVRPLLYDPNISLHLQTEGLKGRHFSESHVRASTESPASVSSKPPQIRLIRKKSGQLVKSSLKSSNSLSVITKGILTKSEPNTPTHAKAVHFDAKLEHVKLFLAEQKPLAVSRDGSPTEDTSGTDSDFPSFIFGDDGAKSKKTLVMQVLNMPPNVNLNADVALEGLTLSSDLMSILGRARVRNIAYSKWLAVRFTFDSWQTTSEVTAKYLESIDNDFDRFTFSIRLNDLLARIEGKRLYLALRYTVAEREFWDNNGANDYLAEFTKVAPPAEHKRSRSSDEESAVETDIADLRSKLEKVVQGRNIAGPSFLAQSLDRNSTLATRYDFGTSLKEPWKHTDFPSPLRHIRTKSYPAVATPPNSIPWPEKAKFGMVPAIKSIPSLGSPRDVDEETLFASPRPANEPEDAPFAVSGDRFFRNHRRGYFDDVIISDRSAVKRTPPGSPQQPSSDESTPMPGSRFRSFPPIDGTRSAPPYGLGFNLDPGEESSLSTPSFASPSSSSPSASPSPTESYMVYALTGIAPNGEKMSPSTNYHQFLTKFCFFTGSDGTTKLSLSPDALIPRTQSASDIEDFLSSTSPRLHASDSYTATTPTRSPSLDDVTGVRSGSSTPTARIMSSPLIPISPTVFSESRSTTPIAV